MRIASIIIKLIIFINVIIKFTTAQPTIIRCCHGSAIADDKLYVGGGVTGDVGNDIWTDDFFFLDLKKPFSTSSPNDIPYEVQAKVPVKSRTHALVYAKNPKGGMIYLFGGHRLPPEGNPIYGYDLEKYAWTPITPKVREGVILPVNSTNKIIGVTDDGLDTVYIFDNRTIFIYDVIHNFWDAGTPAPYAVIRYTAVMLNTGEIAYIGGSNLPDGTANIPMEQILLYNTQTSVWYFRTARSLGSEFPSPRVGHTASIAPDGRIFIYGGFDGNETAIDSPGSTPTFAVLKFFDGEFEWYSPQLFNQSYVMRIFHTSHVYENYLVVTFGRNLTHNRLNTIDLIDIRNQDSYTVVTDYIPDGFVPTKSQPPSIFSGRRTTVIIAAVFGTIGFLTIVGSVFLLVRWYRNRAIPTPSENEGIMEPLSSTPVTPVTLATSSIYGKNNPNSLSSTPSSPGGYNNVNPISSIDRRNNVNSFPSTSGSHNNFYERNSANYTSGAPNNFYERNSANYTSGVPNNVYERNSANYTSGVPNNVYERNSANYTSGTPNNVYERNSANYFPSTSGAPVSPSRSYERNNADYFPSTSGAPVSPNRNYERNNANYFPSTSGAPNNVYERNNADYFPSTSGAPVPLSRNYEGNNANYFPSTSGAPNNVYERNNADYFPSTSGAPVPPSRNYERNTNRNNNNDTYKMDKYNYPNY